MNNWAIYEHPLNEKLKLYLRFEQLLLWLYEYQPNSHGECIGYFNRLFDVMTLLEKGDIRTDLVKEFEKAERQLVQWSEHPQIDSEALEETLQQVIRIQRDANVYVSIMTDLKQDQFLSSIRARFNMPAGYCYFDLPQLHYWVNQPESVRQKQIEHWNQVLSPLHEAISLALQFIRERANFEETKAPNGFYQASTESVELLRIKYDMDTELYPTVSGNRYRFAVRFMTLCKDEGRSHAEESVLFQMACC
ncbi:cell division protein ZapD [Algicola sagamiensis]|uniref:cell division protein ZapD n=1 Tax=Algicola sagamiensis TaxID=163869 RepID=UPI00036832FB|nr:cell division protein ZapD [Algicola sagamiensis]